MNRLIRTLEGMVGDVAIEDLPVPYTAVATDLVARREVWFQQGPLVPAIRASFAIPGLFTPAIIAGRVLVDGGLLNPLPLDPTASAVADFTLAVSLEHLVGRTSPRLRTASCREGRQSGRWNFAGVSGDPLRRRGWAGSHVAPAARNADG